MSYPTSYISSSVVNVDTETTSKIIMLPPASTILDSALYIRDAKGLASVNPIFVSTQTFDLIDNYESTIVLNTDFQSIRLGSWSTTRYALFTNYIQNLQPFTYQIQPAYTFCNVFGSYDFNSTALSLSGERILVTATGGTAASNGIYVSQNTGGTFTKVQSIEASNYLQDNCCMSFNGRFMFVTLNVGILYRSVNYGSNWSELTNTEFPIPYKDVACTSNGIKVGVVTDDYVYISDSFGEGFRSILSYIDTGGIQFRSLCMGTIDTADNYIMFVGAINGGVYQTTDGEQWDSFGPTGTWNHLVCNSNGDIVYGIKSDFTGDFLYKSSNRGRAWTQLTSLTSYSLLSCDATGTFVVVQGGPSSTLYASIDGGSSFYELNPSLTAFGLAMSGDANYIVAVQNPGSVYRGRGRLV